MYYVDKHYPHSLGLSAAFRQWRANSHCCLVHGYALAFTFSFEAKTLDARNWVIDFGSLKPVKEWLVNTFDHRLLVANDDPYIEVFRMLHNRDLASLITMPNVGCEAFAFEAFQRCSAYLKAGVREDVRLARVMCHEHEGNAAGYSEG